MATVAAISWPVVCTTQQPADDHRQGAGQRQGAGEGKGAEHQQDRTHHREHAAAVQQARHIGDDPSTLWPWLANIDRLKPSINAFSPVAG